MSHASKQEISPPPPRMLPVNLPPSPHSVRADFNHRSCSFREDDKGSNMLMSISAAEAFRSSSSPPLGVTEPSSPSSSELSTSSVCLYCQTPPRSDGTCLQG